MVQQLVGVRVMSPPFHLRIFLKKGDNFPLLIFIQGFTIGLDEGHAPPTLGFLEIMGPVNRWKTLRC